MQGLFQLTLQKYVWNYFSPNPPGQPYPKLETQGAEQKATSTAIADTCRNPYAPTLPYHKGDIHNQKYDFSQVMRFAVYGAWPLKTGCRSRVCHGAVAHRLNCLLLWLSKRGGCDAGGLVPGS